MASLNQARDIHHLGGSMEKVDEYQRGMIAGFESKNGTERRIIVVGRDGETIIIISTETGIASQMSTSLIYTCQKHHAENEQWNTYRFSTHRERAKWLTFTEKGVVII